MDQLNAIYRKRWEKQRSHYESTTLRAFPLREGRRIPRKDPIGFLIKIFGILLRISGLFNRGNKNAKEIQIVKNQVKSPKLPEETLTFLHLSDIHLDELPMENEVFLRKIEECESYHFAVITGDLVTGWPISLENQERLDKLFETISPSVETVMVLGNHDSMKMVPYLEQKGVKVLTNQILTYQKSEKIPFSFEIIGTDDPHYFFQRDALRILQEGQKEKFRLGLIHSPELYDSASKNEIDLYLCGHTHGGQIALPGGFAPLRRVYRGKKYYRGAWNFGKMAGYTSSGIGTSGLPIRFNTQAEIILHTVGGMKT